MSNILTDPHHSRNDLRMIEQAIRKNWIFPDAAHSVVVNQMVMIVASPESTNREKTSAASVLTTMHGQNQKDMPPPAPPAPHEFNEHQHIHVSDPQQVLDLEERKRRLSARIAGLRDQPRGSGSGRGVAGGRVRATRDTHARDDNEREPLDSEDAG